MDSTSIINNLNSRFKNIYIYIYTGYTAPPNNASCYFVCVCVALSENESILGTIPILNMVAKVRPGAVSRSSQ